MDKEQELREWKNRLKELVPSIKEQIDWLRAGKVNAEVNPNCPEKLREVAERLVEIQNANGEYQRNKISSADVEKIKYYSKQNNLSFHEVVALAVSNSRYMSKTAVEARGVAGFILEIQSVHSKYYDKHGALPINAMNAEVKRACRNFKTDVSLKDKVEAIIEVFLPELEGVKIVDRDLSVEPQQKPELSSVEIVALIEYFNKMARKGKIDKCFEPDNQREFLKHCKTLSSVGMSLDEFLSKYTGLTFTKCYEIKVVPAIKQMIRSHQARTGTTRKITVTDPYLRHKIEVAQNETGKYSMVELLDELNIIGDNLGDGRAHLSAREVRERRTRLVSKLKELYPSGQIDKDFIKAHPEEYAEAKLIFNRFGFSSMDEFLNSEGFSRERSHQRVMDSVFYLSERDLRYYSLSYINPETLKEWGLKELEPADYIGVYGKLIALCGDHMQFEEENPIIFGK